jgi:hypothetical protein
MLRKMAVWAILGAIMGASLGMLGGGFIGAIAGMVVGTSEVVNLGVIFALLGGTPQEAILGAGGGLLGSLAVGMMGGRAPILLVATVGMMVGAIVGATLHSALRLLALPVVLLGRLLRRCQGRVVIAHTHEAISEHRPFGPPAAKMVLHRRHAPITSE